MSRQVLTKYSFRTPEFTAYAAGCSALPMPGVPFHSMLCSVPPRAETDAHNHAEPEAIVVTGGRAEIRCGSDVVTVVAGEAVLLPPYGAHVLRNTSDHQPLEFMSVYWMPSADEIAGDEDATETDGRADGEIVVFSTPPTPNGELHLGHFSGPYLAGDILRRRLSGPVTPVAHLSGFDDHTSYVWTKAQQLGERPAALAARFTAAIRADWHAMGVRIDADDNPLDDPEYRRFCTAALDKLVSDGHIVAKRADSLHETDSGAYLHEALVTGGCPTCDSTSEGDACEVCGRPHQATELTDPVSTLRPDAALERRSAHHLYFRLEPHRRFLEQHVGTASMSDSALLLSLRMLTGELPDIRISHDVSWGLPVSAAGVSGRLYPWFEMGLLYLWLLRKRFGAGSLRIDGERVEVADRLRRVRIMHCLGFDNAYFHTLLFPALYHALDERLPVPTDYVVNELLNLDGSKFSTSRGHVITTAQILAHADRDYVRLYLAMIRPEQFSTNFTVSDCQRRVNSEFVTPLNELVGRLITVVDATFDGTLPEPGAWTGATWRYHRNLVRRTRSVSDALSVATFSTQLATGAIRELISDTVELVVAAERLTGVASALDRLRTSVALAAVGLNVVRHCLAAIAPEIAGRLAEVLPWADERHDVLEFFPSGAPVARSWQPLPSLDLDGLLTSREAAA